ncbi:MAG: 4-alpha-glucanotransferase [Candidatus Hodarchaeales archaeon]|jgi:4-alpha-glucanotransferase
MSIDSIDLLSSDDLFEKGRYGGILLHPSSLPSEFGIGDLGSNLFRFIDFLNKHGQQLWQVLPLGPTGYGNSPYQSFSAFAGNPLFISPEKMLECGLLTRDDMESRRLFSTKSVDYGKVIPFKWEILERAFDNYRKSNNSSLEKEYEDFSREQHYWLEDYALFMSIKSEHDLRAWNTWEESLKLRDPNVLSKWKINHETDIEFQKFVQFLFFVQWKEVRNYAHQKNVIIIGDIPIFVAHDSADAWANPDLFYIDDRGELLYVAGVPPDYFSKTGQRWGNPLYRWDEMKARGYQWWVQQLKHKFKQVDIIRIDHFRGFVAYWQIPAEEATAVVGKWKTGPGIDFFTEIKKTLGPLPIIAEDLGVITPAVGELLKRTGYPGMRVLQFAFDGNKEQAKNRFLPHMYDSNTIVYTGTHDNDTTKGWFKTTPDDIRDHALKYFDSSKRKVVRDFIRAAWSSVAKMAVIPLQDLLGLGSEARMNTPGTSSGNWEWRFTWKQLTKKKGEQLASLSKLYNRKGSEKKETK